MQVLSIFKTKKATFRNKIIETGQCNLKQIVLFKKGQVAILTNPNPSRN